MTDFLSSSSFFAVILTMAAFTVGSAAQKKTKLAILNPILVGSVIVMAVLKVLDIPNAAYQEGCKLLSYLLTPATICLAIGFYQQFQSLKKHLAAIIVGVLAGTVCCLGFIYLTSKAFGLDQTVIASLLPKSITTAIGTVLSEEIGGAAAITTFAIAVTGISGNTLGPALCRLFRIQDTIAQGVALGTSAHVVGTAKATEMSQLAGAVGSLSLTIAGLITVVLLSFMAQFL